VLPLLLLVGTGTLWAQKNPDLFQPLEWRSIGPYRGGRVTTVAGVDSQPLVYYMGATGGGVWKTTDAGITWEPISDGYFKTGSVGSIAVYQANPSILYVGMGEACLRANLSHGDGMYKSTDAGKTWTHIGLVDTSQIGKVLVDPRNPQVVYVAAVGHPYGPNAERGVFRTRDGGETWRKILFVNDQTGAVDLAMDPRNPQTIYASTWQVLRTPWSINETGPGSAIYKTTDGGDHWTRLAGGLPNGNMGKIGLTVSPVDPNRVWATIGGEQGGIYRSEDAGETWHLLNDAIYLHSRQYYYGHIFADPQQITVVYTFSTKSFYKSIDGGKTWTTLRTPHGDYHDLWIDPHNDLRMVNGNDGGATVTFDGGKSWSSEMNQPTGQFYTVQADNAFPYRVYGAQQDNTTISIASRTTGPGINATDWHAVGGGESGYVVPDPQDPNIVYAGSYWGMLTRYDQGTGLVRNISVWPDYPGGRTAAQMKFRFQWTFPIAISPADSGTVYAGADVLFKSTDQGQSWQQISPDLTRNNIRRENGGRLEEFYSTIFTIAPSPVNKSVIWTGSDDGLIFLTRDGGKTWKNVTPPVIHPWTRINIIDASPEDPATAYVAANRYQLDDFHPYVYRTHDFGKTWKLITTGIPDDTFARTVREDPLQKDLLFAGTETGVYVSLDDGDHWQSLQRNLPIVPITDLAVKDGDLVASTQGRAFWILDDITPLEQSTTAIADSKAHLFHPRPAYRMLRSFAFGGGRDMGRNPTTGVIVDYWLGKASTGPIALQFLDAKGDLIVAFNSMDRPKRGIPGVTNAEGLNRFVWNMRYPGANGITDGTHLSGGNLLGPQAVPGSYTVKLIADGLSFTQTFQIRKDPRWTATQADLEKQFDFLIAVRDKLSAANDAINAIDAIRKQVGLRLGGAENPSLTAAGRKLDGQLTAILAALYQPRFTGFDDQMLKFSLKLNNRIAALQGYAEGAYAPTAQDNAVFQELSAELARLLGQLRQTLASDLPAFNAQLRAAGLPPVVIPGSGPEDPRSHSARHHTNPIRRGRSQ
jgi:photosystem II stability/assembly factor-like uncharacterized protein